MHVVRDTPSVPQKSKKNDVAFSRLCELKSVAIRTARLKRNIGPTSQLETGLHWPKVIEI